MALSADRDGFLIGEKVQIDTAGMERSLEIWRAIRADTREVLNILRGSGIRRGVRATGTQAAQQGAATPTRAVAAPRAAAKASEPTRAQIARPVQARAATPVRDGKGRFIASEKRASAMGKGSGASPRDGGGSGAIGRAATAIADALKSGAGDVASGAEGIDPLLGAAKEARDILSPLTKIGGALGGGLMGLFQSRQERRKRKQDADENAKANAKQQVPWFKRILRALGANGGGEGGAGGGLLSGLLTMFAGRGAGGLGGGLLSGLFGGLAARGGGGMLARLASGAKGMKGLFSAGGLKTLGAVALPLTAISSARDSFGKSSEEYAQRYGVELGNNFAKDLIVRAMGVMQDFGNAITGGLAGKLGNWASGLFSGSGAPEKPSGGQNVPNATRNPFWKWGGSGPSGGRGAAGPTGAPMSSAPAGAGALLDLIGSKEGGKAGYDAFWNGSRVKPSKPMSQMTFGEVMQWQTDTLNEQARRGVKPSRRSSAAGRYQFLSSTLKDTMARAGLGANDMFSAENQDKLALTLLNQSKSSGLDAWRSGKATDAQFANYVASQWASIKDSNGFGRYNAAGFNHASVSADAVIRAAQGMKAAPAVPKVPAPSAKATVAPKVSQMALPKEPSFPTQIGSAGKPPDPVEVIIPQHLSQNLSDRGIAQLATGGMGGSGLGQRMT